MRGDYSRKQFDPEQHYSGVLQQQGRVALDAEWNEQAAIQDRRWRVETTDVIGRCGVPADMAHSFAITAAGADLFVGAGRIYVDGLLAENHGIAPMAFIPALEENYGTEPTPLAAQPYGPPDFPVLPDGRQMLYVDVWTREVAHRQVDGLVEPAIGVDTTTREQTAWSVRALTDIGDDENCGTPFQDFQGWPAGNLPSGARLTTATVEVDIEEDPCIIPPSGGYRGLENQLYRVEVHDTPAAGTTRIKWSRDNATVSASVLEVFPGGEMLRVDQVGKDDNLRIKNGDWVEFTNNARELAGLPGEMRQVQVVDDTRTVEFNTALPADLLADIEAEHLRAVRWDQKKNLDADGLIELNAGDSVVLEAGIEATLDLLAGMPAHAGDYWCFAARAVGTGIENLDNEPPAGIHHHFCKLAIVSVVGGEVTDIVDCRPLFPPLTDIQSGCCTVVVRPGQDIQQAIDSLPPEGGCICLKTGEHVVERPLRIRRSNISIHGESAGTVLVRNNGLTILDVGSDDFSTLTDVVISMLHFDVRVSDDTFEAAVVLRRLDFGAVEHCRISTPRRGVNTGISMDRCEDVRVISCRLENPFIGILVPTDSTQLTLENNLIRREVQRVDDGLIGIWLRDGFGPSRIEHNEVSGYLSGIVVNKEAPASEKESRSAARGSRIAGNQVNLQGPNDFGEPPRNYAIDVAAPGCIVEGNRLSYSANWHTGVRASASRIAISGNTFWSSFFADQQVVQLPIGIQYGSATNRIVLNDGIVDGNTLNGDQHGILITGSDSHAILNNAIRGSTDYVRTGVTLSNASKTDLRGNRISNVTAGVLAMENDGLAIDNHIADNRLENCDYGVLLSEQVSPRLKGNDISFAKSMAVMAFSQSGTMEISGNRITSSGFESETAYAVVVLLHDGELRMAHNDILNTGSVGGSEIVAALAIGIRGQYVRQCLLESNRIAYDGAPTPNPLGEHRALLLQGLSEEAIEFGDRVLVRGYGATISGNRCSGPGRTALVEIREERVSDVLNRRFERLIVSNNDFDHQISEINPRQTATVHLRGRKALVNGNQFKSLGPVPSVNFNKIQSTYMGNASMAPPLNFLGVPAVLDDFNLQ